jgi:hypothetical protein
MAKERPTKRTRLALPWTEYLVPDMVHKILASLDPWTLFVYGQVSKGCREERGLVLARPGRQLIRIRAWTLYEAYGTPQVYDWVARQWPREPGKTHNLEVALSSHNFALAGFLKGWPGYVGGMSFQNAICLGDYAVMNWMDSAGFPIMSYHVKAAYRTGDDAILDWFLEKPIRWKLRLLYVGESWYTFRMCRIYDNDGAMVHRRALKERWEGWDVPSFEVDLRPVRNYRILLYMLLTDSERVPHFESIGHDFYYDVFREV